MAEKLYYSMGEVAELFDVNASLIRHWESQFSVIRPARNKKGNRLFTVQDVEHLKVIYHLVKERGMTLEGAKKALRQHKAEGGVKRDADLMERLQRIRGLLVEVREELRDGDDDRVIHVEDTKESEMAEPLVPRRRAESVEKVVETIAEPKEITEIALDGVAMPDGRTAKVATAIETPADSLGVIDAKSVGGEFVASHKSRRKKEDAENKELFAFYEQSLF